MAIQSSINAMLGTAAGAMTAVVAKAKMFDDANVSDQANQRAQAIAAERQRKRRLYGAVNMQKAMGDTQEVKQNDSHSITVDNPNAMKYTKEDRRANALMNLEGGKK